MTQLVLQAVFDFAVAIVLAVGLFLILRGLFEAFGSTRRES